MLPDIDLLKTMTREEVIAEVKRCLKISKERLGIPMDKEDERDLINSYLLAMGYEMIE